MALVVISEGAWGYLLGAHTWGGPGWLRGSIRPDRPAVLVSSGYSEILSTGGLTARRRRLFSYFRKRRRQDPGFSHVAPSESLLPGAVSSVLSGESTLSLIFQTH